MCCSRASRTFGRVPRTVTKSLCPDGSFHTKMTRHNLTETVKRNLNFESDWAVKRVAFLWNTGGDVGGKIFPDANHFQFNSFSFNILFNFGVHTSFHIDLDHRNIILDTNSLHFPLSLLFMLHHGTLSPYSKHKFYATLSLSLSPAHPQHHRFYVVSRTDCVRSKHCFRMQPKAPDWNRKVNKEVRRETRLLHDLITNEWNYRSRTYGTRDL